MPVCIAGASLKDAYLDLIRKAHFSDVAILEETRVLFDLAAADPLLKAGFESLSLSKDDYSANRGIGEECKGESGEKKIIDRIIARFWKVVTRWEKLLTKVP